MADEPEVKPGETVIEPTKVAEVPGETVAGDALDAQAEAAAERERFLTEIVARTVTQTVAQLRSATQPTATPPTTAAGPVADLEREALAIQTEMRALDAQTAAAGGHTADTLVKRIELTDRTSALRAEATMRAVRMGEEAQQVRTLGAEERWQDYYRDNRTRGDVAILRLAWEREEAKRAPEKTPVPPKLADRTPVVDISGASEVTSADRRARTMTSAQVHATKERLTEEGKLGEIRKLDSQIRDGEVILKG